MFNLFKNWFSTGKPNANTQYKANAFSPISTNKSFKSNSGTKQASKNNPSDTGSGTHSMAHQSHFDNHSCRSSSSSPSDSYSSNDCGGGDGGGGGD